jgi:glycosyltransferase involved in cell wall biosynthesis
VANKKVLTVLSPVFNEQDNIEPFIKELNLLKKDCENLGLSFQVVFMDNCSSDQTVSLIKKISQTLDHVFILSLSRNFGYQKSLLSGLTEIESDFYLIMDCDGEEPIEIGQKFLEVMHSGNFSIVYGERNSRPEPKYIAAMRWLFYRGLSMLADGPSNTEMAEFSLFKKEIRDAIISTKTTFPFLRNEIAYAGFPSKAIPYRRNKRRLGQSKYNFFGMFAFAVAGLLTATTFPLRLVAYSYLFLAPISLGLFFLGYPLLGLQLAILHLGFAGSIISIYLSRVYHNGITRPPFIINRPNSILPKKTEK